MGIKYCEAEDIKRIAEDIIKKMCWEHVKLNDIFFLRSVGSSSRGTIARCHALSRPLQIALKREGFYLIEVIHERFDKLSEEEKIKVVIHELMHIPKAFGGGFIHHHMVNESSVEKIFNEYMARKREGESFAKLYISK
jgi:predicted metallopeptidase